MIYYGQYGAGIPIYYYVVVVWSWCTTQFFLYLFKLRIPIKIKVTRPGGLAPANKADGSWLIFESCSQGVARDVSRASACDLAVRVKKRKSWWLRCLQHYYNSGIQGSYLYALKTADCAVLKRVFMH